ncbi:MAG: sulfatase [Deltaproteobacteria bacterium]|nr:sulfatase [Deltaproteobacteria bacterium]
MSKWKGITVFLVACSLIATGCGKLRETVSIDRQPNVVLIMIDTLRADHLGVYGYSRPTSPNIDRFAADAVVFDRMHAVSPWTMPSTASIFTSLPPRDHGITEWENPLEERFLTLAEHLQSSGYKTEAIVSHVIFRPRYGFNQGFDRFEALVLGKGKSRLITSSREVTDRAIKAVDRGGREPFFLWVHYFDPHNNYLRHEEFDFGKKKVDLYDGEIAYTDKHIGRLLDHLRKTGRFKDTVIAIIADHGEEFGDHGGTWHSRTLYEEVLRVPFILRAPGFSPGRVDTVLWQLDVAPTILSLLNVAPPPSFQGRVIEHAEGRFIKGADRTVFAETYRFADKRAVFHENRKYIEDREAKKTELFDLGEDPKEQNNVVDAQPERAAALRAMLEEHHTRARAKISSNPIPGELAEELKSLGYLQ